MICWSFTPGSKPLHDLVRLVAERDVDGPALDSHRPDGVVDDLLSDGQAGSTPEVETRPRVGFIPTMPLNAAGTRPLPAVSVPSASGTMPAATATAEPDELPPLTCRSDATLWQAP